MPTPKQLRFSILAALIVVAGEYAALSAAFDAAVLGARTDAWRLIGQVGWVAAFAAAAACGMALAGLVGDPDKRRALMVSRPLDRDAALLLLLHVGLMTGFWWVSAAIFRVAGPPSTSPRLWIAGWVGLGGGVALSALAAAVPAGQWKTLVRSSTPFVLGGLVVGAAAWVAAVGSHRLWNPLGPWTLHGAEAMLRTLGVPMEATTEDAVIATERFAVHVAPECAGFEGVGLMAVFLTAVLVLGRRDLRFPMAFVLLPIGLAAAIAVNVLRITLLVVIGGYVSEEIAIAGFHAKAGWLLFCLLALAIAATAHHSALFSRHPGNLQLAHPTAAYLLPFLTILAAAFVTGLFARQLDLLYGVRVLAAALVLAGFRTYYRDLGGTGRPASIAWSVGLGLAAAALFVLLSPRGDAEEVAAGQQQLQSLSAGARAAWIALRLAGSVIVIPVAEELAFRGYLLRRIVHRHFDEVAPGQRSWPALALSSVAFGAVHGGWLAGTLAGVLFGLAQWQGARVMNAVVAHVVSNAVVAVCVLGFGQWWLWM